MGKSRGSRRNAASKLASQQGGVLSLSESNVSSAAADQTPGSAVSVTGLPCTKEQEGDLSHILYVFQIQMAEVPEEFMTDLTKQQIIFSVLGIMVEQLEEKGYAAELIQAGLQNLMHHHILSLMENAIKVTRNIKNPKILNIKMEAILHAAPRDLRARPTFTQDLERLAVGPDCPEVVLRCLRQWKLKPDSLASSAEECCVVCLDKPPDTNMVCEQCKKAAMCKPCSRLLGKAYGAEKECPLCRHPARSTKKK